MDWRELLVDLEYGINKKSDLEILEQALKIVKNRWEDQVGSYKYREQKTIVLSLGNVIMENELYTEKKCKENIIHSMSCMAECYADEQWYDADEYLLDSVFSYIKVRNIENYIEIIKDTFKKVYSDKCIY